MSALTARAILFDMDGVLVDSRAVVERAWRWWAAGHGLAAEPLLRVAHGRRTSDTLREVCPDLATPEEVARLDGAELRDFEGIVAVPGAQELTASLPRTSWAVVTSAGRTLALGRLAAAGIDPPDWMVTSDDVPRGKPAPDGYLLAAARFGAEPADCLVVEDTPPGIAAGRAAGMRVVALTTTYEPDRLAGAHLVVTDLRGLSVTATGAGLAVHRAGEASRA